MRATAKAPANIAFVKYWGKKNEAWRIPENDSLSMCLDNENTVTTVEFRSDLTSDEVVIDGKQVQSKLSLT